MMRTMHYIILSLAVLCLAFVFAKCDLHNWNAYPNFGNESDDDNSGDDDDDDSASDDDDDSANDDDVTSADWPNKETVVSIGNVKFISAAIGSDGAIFIAFYDDGPKTLRFIKKQGSSWDTAQDVDTNGETGQYPSIALGSEGRPAIAYQGNGTTEVRYAYFDGSQWNTEVVATALNTGWYNSLAFVSGTPCIAWQDKDYALMYSCRQSQSSMKWTQPQIISKKFGSRKAADDDSGEIWGSGEGVDGNPGDDIGSYASLLFTSDLVAHIAYRNSEDKVQSHAYKESDVWVPEVVDQDSSDNVGGYCSLAADNANDLHLAYYDQTNKRLMYAKKVNGSSIWTKEAVDKSGNAGWDTSLKIRQDQKPCISYKDNLHNYLRFACREGDDNWVIEAPDTTSGVGRYSNLVINPSTGAYHIIYHDGNPTSGKILHVWKTP